MNKLVITAIVALVTAVSGSAFASSATSAHAGDLMLQYWVGH
jgi:hypothetical protein